MKLKMSNTCLCLYCNEDVVVNEFKTLIDVSNIFETYVYYMNRLFRMFTLTKTCTRTHLNLTVCGTKKLTELLVSKFPDKQLLSDENCMLMKKAFEKTENKERDLTFKILYSVYIRNCIHPPPSDEEIYEVEFKYCLEDEDDYLELNMNKIKCLHRLYLKMNQKYIELETRNKQLEAEVTHYKYMPGGSGYEEAKQNFETIANQ